LGISSYIVRKPLLFTNTLKASSKQVFSSTIGAKSQIAIPPQPLGKNLAGRFSSNGLALSPGEGLFHPVNELTRSAKNVSKSSPLALNLRIFKLFILIVAYILSRFIEIIYANVSITLQPIIYRVP